MSIDCLPYLAVFIVPFGKVTRCRAVLLPMWISVASIMPISWLVSVSSAPISVSISILSIVVASSVPVTSWLCAIMWKCMLSEQLIGPATTFP